MGRTVTVSERRLSGKTSLKVNCNYGDVHHWRKSGEGGGGGAAAGTQTGRGPGGRLESDP